MNRLKAGVAGAVLALTIAGPTAGAAFGGEITGGPNPKFTPVNSGRASSICSFSGQEDGLALIGFDPVTGAPIIIEVEPGPASSRILTWRTRPGSSTHPASQALPAAGTAAAKGEISY